MYCVGCRSSRTPEQRGLVAVFCDCERDLLVMLFSSGGSGGGSKEGARVPPLHEILTRIYCICQLLIDYYKSTKLGNVYPCLIV